MSVLITKSRGRNWRFMAVNVETGEVLGYATDMTHLNRRLWRAGYRLTFALVRPWEVCQ